MGVPPGYVDPLVTSHALAARVKSGEEVDSLTENGLGPIVI